MKNNPFIYSSDNKRYHTLNYYNKIKFGTKIFKAVLDCGFTCPNIDGSKGYGGCIFCDSGSGYFTNGLLPLKEQLENEINRICSKHGSDSKVIAYFQSNTNTYAPVAKLMEQYSEVLKHKNVHGISIGTRADCLDADILDCLEELNNKTNLTVELGLQTVHNNTIEYINRCCTHEEFVFGFQKLKKRNIRVCLHIINGLPGESEEMMLETARQAAILNPDAVKIQMLHVIQNTKLAEIYNEQPFNILSKEDYIDITVKQLEFFSPHTVIERITGDGDKAKLIAPKWSADKISVLGSIDKKQADCDSWQGKLHHKI